MWWVGEGARGNGGTAGGGWVETVRGRGGAGGVIDERGFVGAGNVVTAAGVSAGIDRALWVVGQMDSPGFARLVQRAMEYDPAPPYSADV